MKANRKFTRGDDAVSPVIAVILMVAITVVLAATVYAWVSGFSSNTTQPARSISLSTSGAIERLDADDTLKRYTLTAASNGLKFRDLTFTLDGAALEYNVAFANDTIGYQVSGSDGSAIAADAIGGTFVKAGQVLSIHFDGDLDGKTLRVVDTQANSVLLTMVVG